MERKGHKDNNNDDGGGGLRCVVVVGADTEEDHLRNVEMITVFRF